MANIFDSNWKKKKKKCYWNCHPGPSNRLKKKDQATPELLTTPLNKLPWVLSHFPQKLLSHFLQNVLVHSPLWNLLQPDWTHHYLVQIHRMLVFLDNRYMLGGINLCWFVSLGFWITWFISNWEIFTVVASWANSQNDNFFHSKWQQYYIFERKQLSFCKFSQLVTTV